MLELGLCASFLSVLLYLSPYCKALDTLCCAAHACCRCDCCCCHACCPRDCFVEVEEGGGVAEPVDTAPAAIALEPYAVTAPPQ